MPKNNNNNFLPTPYQQYIHLSRYSRWLPELGRRETWPETINRYFNFFEKHLKENCKYNLTAELRKELEDAVLNLEVMPSMRGLMTAGAALERDPAAIYNCAFTVVDNPKAFGEIMYTLMLGVGVGFSVERQFINKLPTIPDELQKSDTTITVSDSRVGWAKATNELISILYAGSIPNWDLSKLRPAGAVLKTFGGRSSGPGPLNRVFEFIIETFKNATGRKLTSLECHDICCVVAEAIVSGGVRRSATISLSNLSDDRMRNAKSGQWWTIAPWRAMANNSAVYEEKIPSMDTFMSEWKSLFDSKSGERGIFSRYAAKNIIERNNDFRKRTFGEEIRIRDSDHIWGCNPCSEILLRDKSYCNLSEIIIRENDNLKSLQRKIRIATILGTFQSTLTEFKFINKKWKDNVEDERLLGVSMTGIMDNELTSGKKGKDKLKECLTELKKTAIQTNKEFSDKLNIAQSTAISCCKPSGTVSELTSTSSGIHARHSKYYIRRVRSDKKDPISQLMIDNGIPHEEDKMNKEAWVFSFPQKSPDNAIFRNDMSAIEQLELWMMYQMYYTEHKPSVTISVKEDEWMKVGAWVYENFEWVSGISFLPHSEHIYEQAPFEEIDKETYEKLLPLIPKSIDWSKLSDYEKEDMTEGAQTLACVAGGCAI
jgi:ribonucleoside-triphosphate reductase